MLQRGSPPTTTESPPIMLQYLLRTLPTALRALRRRSDPQYISRLRRRVGVHEIDLNLHMNQAAYAQVMELGRTDWALASGAWASWRGQRILPVVAEQTLVYRRELGPLAAYQLDTRAVGQEGRLMVFETTLTVGDTVHARGTAKLIFSGPGGVMGEAEVRPLVAPYVVDRLAVRDWRVVG